MARPRKTIEGEISPFIQRLNEVLAGTTAKDFALKAGIPSSTFGDILNGTEPKISNLMAIAGASGRSVEWLVNGTEPPEHHGEAIYYIEHQDIHASAGGGYINDLVENDGDRHFIRIPNLVFKKLRIKRENARIVFVKGNSMSPTLNDGEMMIIDKNQFEPAEGSIYLFTIDDDLYVKRLNKNIKKQWVAYSDNTDFKPMPLPEDDSFKIVGKVVWSEKRY
jgi:phage repressor protein C with HTH and peptisase S24 domain